MENVQIQQPAEVHESREQEHPIGIYLKVWILLFVLSFFSYMVDYFDFQGMLRWTLIIIFMFLKAGFIVAVFMHVMWERMALITAILGPPLLLLFLIGFMISEGFYVFGTRVDYMGRPAAAERVHVTHGEEAGHVTEGGH
jgi:cytochrome c oxidase subunit 4